MEDWITVALEEYKSLRTETLDAVKGQQTVQSSGIASLGVLIVAGFTFWDKYLLAGMIFLILIPTLCYLIINLWLTEVSRMTRAGYYLSHIEKKISSHFTESPKVLNWENWLRSTSPKKKKIPMVINYLSSIAFFFAVSAFAITIGEIRLLTSEFRAAHGFNSIFITLNVLLAAFSFFTVYRIFRAAKINQLLFKKEI
jgi:hypothetical protein